MFSSYFANAQDVDSSLIRYTLSNSLHSKESTLVQNLYASMGYSPIWVGEQNQQKTKELLLALKNPLFNYKEKDLGQKEIKKLMFMADNSKAENKAQLLAKLDIAISNSFIKLVNFIYVGDVDWNMVKDKIASLKQSDGTSASWEMQQKEFPNQNALAGAVAQGKIEDYLTSLIPFEDKYKTLINLYDKYHKFKPFNEIPYSYDDLQIGSNSPRVMLVKKRLQELGDYPAYLALNNNFDNNLREAVLSFQKRFNLEETGIFDRVTNYYLNTTLSTYLKTIATNLDKTKIYPKTLNDQRIEVNIPSYSLTYYDNNKPKINTKVVLGRTDRPTPIINDYIEYMVLNPTWTVTDNLIKKDLIGVLREEPNYLKEHNIRVYAGNEEIELEPNQLDEYENSSSKVPYRFIQDPGEKNVLGKVKFAFPNSYDVFLHDTDNKDLFNRRYRVYSSGCIRMQKPLELAKALLETRTNGKYNENKMQEMLDSNKTATIKLDKSVPINILYFTVTNDRDKVYFDYDIYMYDQIIQESTEGNKKPYFEIPKQRMVKIEKKTQKDEEPAP
ncbi:MAG: L,D-transpeptidase family protein [Sulfurovaceae bacterium]|nr:L,D-transpeptidase family protein [Sulfurovaceae bacterium]